MAMDMITTILLLAGIIMLLVGLMSSGRTSKTIALVGLFVLIVGVGSVVNIIDFSDISGLQSGVFTGVQPNQFTPSQAAPVSSCSANAITSNGLSQARVVYRNVDNSSLSYNANLVSANSGGQLIDSGTTNAGSSPSYVSLSNIPNCGSGELVATTTTGITGAAPSRRVRDVEANQVVTGYSFNDKAAHVYEILGSSYHVVSAAVFDALGNEYSSVIANGSTGDEMAAFTDVFIGGTGTADGTLYVKNTSLGAKGTLNTVIWLRVNGTATAYGAYDEPDSVVISYDTGTASVFSKDSLSLFVNGPAGFSITKLPNCPDDITNNRNTERCWVASGLKSGNLYELKGTLTADLGDPLVGQTFPSIWVDDKVFFRDTDGTLKYSAFSSSGTNQGAGGTQLQYVLS